MGTSACDCYPGAGGVSRASLGEEVQALEGLDLHGLRAFWRRRWGEVPRLRSRDHLARAAAHRLQAAALGDLAPTTRRRMRELASAFMADRRFTPEAGPALKPGSTLIREWGGIRHEVAVMESGFAYQGVTHRSLSSVASAITGTKWNGPLFFGLRAGDQGKAQRPKRLALRGGDAR